MPSRSEFWEQLTSVSDILAYSFDLHVAPDLRPPDWFSLEGERCVVRATDLANGAYIDCQSPPGEQPTRTAYVDRGGGAFVLGPDFAHVVALVVQLPWWREVLQRAHDGASYALRDAARRCEREFTADLPWLGDAQQEIRKEVALPELSDPVGVLHRWAVRPTPPLRVVLASGVASYGPGAPRVAERSASLV